MNKLLDGLLDCLKQFKCLETSPARSKRGRSPWTKAFCELYHPLFGPWGKFSNVYNITDKPKRYYLKGNILPIIYDHLKKNSKCRESGVQRDLFILLDDYYKTVDWYKEYMAACEKVALVEMKKPLNERVSIPSIPDGNENMNNTTTPNISSVEIEGSHTVSAANGKNDNTCSSVVTTDIASMKIVEIKKELESFGIPTRRFLMKEELVEALINARVSNNEERSNMQGSTANKRRSEENQLNDSRVTIINEGSLDMEKHNTFDRETISLCQKTISPDRESITSRSERLDMEKAGRNKGVLPVLEEVSIQNPMSKEIEDQDSDKSRREGSDHYFDTSDSDYNSDDSLLSIRAKKKTRAKRRDERFVQKQGRKLFVYGRKNSLHKENKWPDIDAKDFIRISKNILNKVRSLDVKELFHIPVKEKYPEISEVYSHFVKSPMDLKTIEEKRLQHYNTISELQDDLIKIFRNCIIYNGRNHTFSKYAIELWDQIDTIFRETRQNAIEEEMMQLEGMEDQQIASKETTAPKIVVTPETSSTSTRIFSSLQCQKTLDRNTAVARLQFMNNSTQDLNLSQKKWEKAVIIQTFLRSFIAHKKYVSTHRNIKILQRHVRGYLGRLLYFKKYEQNQRKKTSSAIIIQCYFRAFNARRAYSYRVSQKYAPIVTSDASLSSSKNQSIRTIPPIHNVQQPTDATKQKRDKLTKLYSKRKAVFSEDDEITKRVKKEIDKIDNEELLNLI